MRFVGPLDQIPLIAVGGVKVDQFSEYLRAGAIASRGRESFNRSDDYSIRKI